MTENATKEKRLQPENPNGGEYYVSEPGPKM